MNLIACSHAGRNGDALYSLPTIRELCRIHEAKADFYTIPDCAPIQSFMEYQDCINQVFITTDYKNISYPPGSPFPWEVEFSKIDKQKYLKVFDLSYHSFPNCPLPEFTAKQAGLPAEIGRHLRYDSPFFSGHKSSPYLVMAPRADRDLGFLPLFNEIAEKSKLPVMVVGKKGEMIGHGTDLTHMNFLEMALVISCAKGFVGLLSAPLVIAHGFDIPKAVVYDGESWDSRHVIRDPFTKYLIKPTAKQVLEVFE